MFFDPSYFGPNGPFSDSYISDQRTLLGSGDANPDLYSFSMCLGLQLLFSRMIYSAVHVLRHKEL